MVICILVEDIYLCVVYEVLCDQMVYIGYDVFIVLLEVVVDDCGFVCFIVVC